MTQADTLSHDETLAPGQWTGRSLPRVEDAALLSGRGRYFDDLGTPPRTQHAAILRSPHGHARVLRVDVDKARALPGVCAVLTEIGRAHV